MVTTRIGSYLLFATGLWAANINITVTGVTPTQAVVAYSAPGPNTCTVALSESSGMSPLVHDVDPVLFPGSSSDTRAGNMSNGVARTLVLGKRSVERAADGKNYSRALQAFTRHYLSVACGANSGTAVFTTENPPLGNNAPEVPLFDAAAFGNYAQPTIDFSDQTVTYVDPLTGILLRRATTPGADGDISDFVNFQFSQAIDAHAAWTSPSSILTSSAFASYGGAGTTADTLFLVAPVTLSGLKGFSARSTVLDLRVDLNGKGTAASAADRTLSACLSTDHGQTCTGAVVDFPPLSSGAAALIQFPSAYPSAVMAKWTAAGGTPVITPNMQVRTGTVTVSGSQVNLSSGDTFQDMVPGDVVVIPGAGCANGDQCVIATVVNARRLTLTNSVSGTVTATFTASNFGVKIWKKTTVGTVSLNSARYDFAGDTSFGMPVAGSESQCSTIPGVTTIDRNGAPLSGPLNGYLCMQEDLYGNARLFWNGSNGEVRHISNLTRPAVILPAADAVNFAISLCFIAAGVDPVGNFDATDPNSLYCAGTQTGGGKYDVIYKCTYNSADAAWGNYREWSNNYDVNAENPAMSCVNITKASLGNDLETQLQTLLPGFNPARFQFGPGTTKGRYFVMMARTTQDGIGYFIRFDTVTKRVVYVHDSWTTPPLRWGGIHGYPSGVTPNYGNLYIVPLRAAGATGIGQYQMSFSAIDGLSDTGLTSGYTDARTCQQLGVTDATFMAEGATGRACIAVTTTGEPYDPTPSSADLAVIPHPSNAQSCGGDGSTANCWTKLQDSIEGDYMIDAATNGYYEQFRIVKKISSTRMILQRGASVADCTATQMTPHTARWTALMKPRGSCNAVSYFFDTSGNMIVDSASMGEGHGDVLNDAISDNGVWIQSNYDIRTGPMSSQLGKPATFHSYGSYAPLFAGSTASVQSSSIQSHPSARQADAPAAEFRWALDGRPYGGALGGSTLLFYNSVTPTATASVYKVGPPTLGPSDTGGAVASLDRKRLPLQVWAGRYLLKDKSGAGSQLAANDLWNYCVADFAGECVTGSHAGEVYMNVPQADTTGACLSNFEVNTPCWVSASAAAPFVTQFGIDRADPTGSYWRRVSNFFNGMGWTDNYWNARPLPDASWIFTDSKWLNGYRTEIMMAKLPPWPADDTIQRNTFIPVSLQINGNSQRTYRIRFGYDSNLFCTTRQEQCATVAGGSAPFQWVGEQQPWTNCNGPCQITVPAISGRVLYYVVDAKDAGGVVASTPISVYPVP